MHDFVFTIAVFVISLIFGSLPLVVFQTKYNRIFFYVFFGVIFFNTYIVYGSNFMFSEFSSNVSIKNPTRENAAIRLICPDNIYCSIKENFNSFEILAVSENELGMAELDGIKNRAFLYKAAYRGLDRLDVSRIKIEFWVGHDNRPNKIIMKRKYNEVAL